MASKQRRLLNRSRSETRMIDFEIEPTPKINIGNFDLSEINSTPEKKVKGSTFNYQFIKNEISLDTSMKVSGLEKTIQELIYNLRIEINTIKGNNERNVIDITNLRNEICQVKLDSQILMNESKKELDNIKRESKHNSNRNTQISNLV